jgi:glycosyltransferase involved in cell wall biosynthesis
MALKALGVNLGNNLVRGDANNESGYFEDHRLVKINDRILEKNGSDWKSLKYLYASDLAGDCYSSEGEQARSLLRSTILKGKTFGFKDPRICRTLPFWQKIFKELDLHVGYVLAYRDVEEVVASLKKRDGFALEYSEKLCVSYQVDALRNLKTEKWLLVKYDYLLKKPRRELERIASFLGVAWDPDASIVAEYCNHFLKPSLRHHRQINCPRKGSRYSRLLVPGLEIACRTRNTICQWLLRITTEVIFSRMKKDPDFCSGGFSKPGFWKKLERSIRKRRKKWINRIGFDQDWYLKEYPDVKKAGMDPLYHYLEFGFREGQWKSQKSKNRALEIREKSPSQTGLFSRLWESLRQSRRKILARAGFNSKWYLQEYPDVQAAGLDPFQHFFQLGLQEGRHKNAKQQEVHGKASAAFNINRQKDLASPNNILKQEKIFDENFYLEKYPDVKESKMKAWDHFVRHGHHEGRLAHKIDFSLKTSEVSLSVIIPTYNGQQKISRTIEAISKASHGLDIELIIVNDGSSDQTESVVQALSSKVKNIKLISIKQSGAGIARNTGAKLASKEILLFMGDDISPIGPQFFNVHAVLHKINPQINYSVLGKVEWPDDSYFPITPVMEHIQGSGGEQFGYTDMRPNMFWDWRFFYTCNVSVKRQVVSDWEAEGFDTSFAGCGFEDNEFACRMSKKYGSFNIFYSDQSVGSHYHHHTFLTFFQRQALCGSQLTNLIKLHPECAGKTGVEEVLKILNKNNSNDPELTYKTLESIRQIKRLTLNLEAGGLLGRYEWHKELLRATFRLAYFLGFLNSHAKPNQGYGEALTYIFNNAVRPLVPHLPTSFARP